IHDKQVQGGYLRKVNCACFPVRRVIMLGAIVAVADVVESHLISVDLGPGRFCDIRLPGPIITRFLGAPPNQNEQKESETGHPFAPLPAHENQSCDQNDNERNSSRQAQRCDWKVEIKSTESPQDTK